MTSIHARGRTRRLLLTQAAVVLLAVGVATPALADMAPLKRSFENLTQFPLDMVLSPVTAGTTVVNNLQTVEDSEGVQVFYAVPGYAWNVLVNFSAGILRGMTGLVELPVGVGLAFFPDAEFDPLFPPVEDSEALVDYESDFYNVKFGVEYTGGS